MASKLTAAKTTQPLLPAKVCLISAYDSSGHAGHSCDLRTVQDLGSLGLGVISALTAQNSQRVLDINATTPQNLALQCQALQEDISLDAIKIGMLANTEQLTVLIKFLNSYDGPVIADPVFGSSSGTAFANDNFILQYRALFPFLTLLTPNRLEAEQLLQCKINSPADIENAARQLRALGVKAVLIKGGHCDWDSQYVQDYFDDGERAFWLQHSRQSTSNSRGTGCTLSSAIATFMAQGKRLVDALVLAQAYVQQGLRTGFAIGACGGLLGNRGRPDALQDFPTLVLPEFSQSESPTVQNEKSFPPCESSLGLYSLVDSLEWLEQVLRAGVKTVQLRIKQANDTELDQVIAQAVSMATQRHARLFINDHWQLAIKHNAYGVHLGQEDLSATAIHSLRQAGLHLGISSHSEYEWLRAVAIQPSYIAMGAVFGTTTKTGVRAIGLDNLTHWVQVLKAHYPLVAIGGIDQNNLQQVLAAGVESCAVVGAITQAKHPHQVIAALQRFFPESDLLIY